VARAARSPPAASPPRKPRCRLAQTATRTHFLIRGIARQIIAIRVHIEDFPGSTMKHPNVLFFMADQFRFDAFGRVSPWMRTPNLDRIASAGTLFTNAFSNSLECAPARFSLATGLYAHQTGVWHNHVTTLNPDFASWTQAVEAAGYRTSLFGKAHLHRPQGDLRKDEPLMRRYGFQTVDETTGPPGNARILSNMTALWQARGVWDAFKADMDDRRTLERHYLPRPSSLPLDLYYDVYVPQSAKRYLESLEKGSPWFCWISFGGPHPPRDTPEPYASMYDPNDIPPPLPRMRNADSVRGLVRETFRSGRRGADLSPRQVRAIRADYAGNVSLIDDQIGDVLAAVEARGELDDTVVIFAADHGEMNGDQGAYGKANPFDGSMRIPLIVAPPKSTGPAGAAVCDALVELMDIGATIVDFAGGRAPPLSNARSLRPLVERRDGAFRDFAISEFHEHYVVVTQDWKAEFNERMRPMLLIDRRNDPDEQFDLSRARDMRPILDRLASTLESFLASTPVCEGVTVSKRRKKPR
jgi:choline-sulfatase